MILCSFGGAGGTTFQGAVEDVGARTPNTFYVGYRERIDDNLSPALVSPLQGLAATQASMGRPDLARLSYRRAVHVTHVNDGPHNRGQVDILESLAELNIAQGDYDEAVDIQEHIFSIQSRKVEPDTIDLIPALEKRARWQHRLQRYHRERITWRQIIDILEDHYGKESLELVPALTSLGKSYLFVSPAEFEYWKTGTFHFCVQDPDVEGLVEKIVAHGGKQRMPIREKQAFAPRAGHGHFVFRQDGFRVVIPRANVTPFSVKQLTHCQPPQSPTCDSGKTQAPPGCLPG